MLADTTPLQSLLYADVQICANMRKVLPLGRLVIKGTYGWNNYQSVPSNLSTRLDCQNSLIHTSATTQDQSIITPYLTVTPSS